MPLIHPIHIDTIADGDGARLTRETDDGLWLDLGTDERGDPRQSVELALNKRQALALAEKIVLLYRGRRVASEDR